MDAFIQKYRKLILWGLFPLVVLLMHLHILNRELVGIHVWRQTQTQANVLNFAQKDMDIRNPRVYNLEEGLVDGIKRMEFPLMQWAFAVFYRIFDADGPLISRLGSFLIWLMSMWGMYHLFRLVFQDEKVALAGTWAFLFSPVVYYYFVNPLPDNLSLCFGIWGMVFAMQWHRRNGRYDLLLAGIFLGLGTLVKLPFILLYALPGGMMLWNAWTNREKAFSRFLLRLGVLLLTLIPAVIWYAWVMPEWRNDALLQGATGSEGTEFAKLFHIATYHLYAILPEVLLNYASVPIFLAGWFFLFKKRLFKRPLMFSVGFYGLAVIAYFLYEMNMIETAHDYYLFPFLPGLFLLVGLGAKVLIARANSWNWQRVLVLAWLVVLPLTAFLRMNNRWNLEKPGFNKTVMEQSLQFRELLPENAVVVAGPDGSPHVWLYYLRRQGWVFQDWQLTEPFWRSCVEKGANVLVTDFKESRIPPQILTQLEKAPSPAGDIQIYYLKTAWPNGLK